METLDYRRGNTWFDLVKKILLKSAGGSNYDAQAGLTFEEAALLYNSGTPLRPS